MYGLFCIRNVICLYRYLFYSVFASLNPLCTICCNVYLKNSFKQKQAIFKCGTNTIIDRSSAFLVAFLTTNKHITFLARLLYLTSHDQQTIPTLKSVYSDLLVSGLAQSFFYSPSSILKKKKRPFLENVAGTTEKSFHSSPGTH